MGVPFLPSFLAAQCLEMIVTAPYLRMGKFRKTRL